MGRDKDREQGRRGEEPTAEDDDGEAVAPGRPATRAVRMPATASCWVRSTEDGAATRSSASCSISVTATASAGDDLLLTQPRPVPERGTANTPSRGCCSARGAETEVRQLRRTGGRLSVVRYRSGRRVRGLAALALGALSLTLAFGAASVDAGLGVSCPDPTTQPFRPWSDYARYARVPDGGFEAGATGWKLAGGAKVVAGNNPFYLRDPDDRSSLQLPAGSSATSPPMCIGLLSSRCASSLPARMDRP